MKNLPVVLANNQEHILFHTLCVLDHTGSNCTSTPSEPTPSHQRHLHQRHLHQLISLSTNAVCTNYAERTNEQTSDQAKERTSERRNERTNERAKEQANERANDPANDPTNDPMNDRANERTTERTTETMPSAPMLPSASTPPVPMPLLLVAWLVLLHACRLVSKDVWAIKCLRSSLRFPPRFFTC